MKVFGKVLNIFVTPKIAPGTEVNLNNNFPLSMESYKGTLQASKNCNLCWKIISCLTMKGNIVRESSCFIKSALEVLN